MELGHVDSCTTERLRQHANPANPMAGTDIYCDSLANPSLIIVLLRVWSGYLFHLFPKGVQQ
jgi:hypothetical protein